MVLDSVDAASAGAIVARAKQSQVPVISYDRLITDADIDYYISFDNEQVGKLQGDSLQAKLDEGRQRGRHDRDDQRRPTDNNAKLFKQGAMSVFDQSDLKIGKSYDTLDWSPDKAQQEMEQAITALGKDGFVGVYAANDGTAGRRDRGHEGQRRRSQDHPVDGQDAELAAIQRILVGEQYMTVYKAIKPEAEQAAELAVALVQGTEEQSELVNAEIDNGQEKVPRCCSSRWRSPRTTSRTPSSRTVSGRRTRSARAPTPRRARRPASIIRARTPAAPRRRRGRPVQRGGELQP